MIWIRALELQQRLERKTGINPWLATRYGSRLIAFPKLLTQKKENKVAKKSKPKVIADEKNSILDLIQKLIGTRKKKTFWDWLTSK
tara:strand:- start:86 stop:343 length:258 start_codon:yes stop_codon:yes gene_type:complete